MKTVDDKTIVSFMKMVGNATDFDAAEYEMAFDMVFNMLKDRKLKRASDALERIAQ